MYLIQGRSGGGGTGALVHTERTSPFLLGKALHLRSGAGQLSKMGKMATGGAGHPDGQADKRKRHARTLAINRFYAPVLSVLGVIKGWYDVVEDAQDIAAGILNERVIHNEYEIVPADMSYETSLRLFAFDDVENQTAGYLDNLIPAGKSVPVVEGLEIRQVGVGKGK